jgi:hypothetical protein
MARLSPGAGSMPRRTGASRAVVNRYTRLIEHVFQLRYTAGAAKIEFLRSDIELAARELGIDLPKNIGDVVYTFRYRAPVPDSIRAQAPTGHYWRISPAGKGKYAFVASTTNPDVMPSRSLAETKIPDATPGLIARNTMDDEQALLAKLQYNRLIDTFAGLTCYSLQNHLRTTVRGIGQVETDEVYVGVDRRGVQYVLPVQAKTGRDPISLVQIEQDFAMCAEKFSLLVARPVAATLAGDGVIAMFEFERSDAGAKVVTERHYRLVEPEGLSATELHSYRRRPEA